MEHKSLRYTWELVRHIYLVDLETEIEIRQVEISLSHENRLIDPPYPFTPFFEIEIDQIQKNGKTIFSLRNICPVQIKEKSDWNFLNPLTQAGSSRVIKRFQSHDGENETRWLYTDDFFLISLSSGDRHDLSMLLSLIINKLNMIALSIQSGRRISSEFENQQKYRAAMSTMFSDGIKGAFRDVPVYQQHGEMTDTEIDVSAALMSTELQDLNAIVASEDSVPAINPIGQTHSGPAPSGDTTAVSTAAQDPRIESTKASSPSGEIIPEVTTSGTLQEPSAFRGELPEDRMQEVPVPETSPVTKEVPEGEGNPEIIPETVALLAGNPEDNPEAEPVSEENAPVTFFPESGLCRGCGAQISGTTKFCSSCGTEISSAPMAEGLPSGKSCSACGAKISITTKFCGSCGTAVSTAPPGERALPEQSCSSCGCGISSTTKFCGGCGTAVSTAPPAECAPVPSRITAIVGDDTSDASSESAAAPVPVVNLKTIENLKDLSWLTD